MRSVSIISLSICYLCSTVELLEFNKTNSTTTSTTSSLKSNFWIIFSLISILLLITVTTICYGCCKNSSGNHKSDQYKDNPNVITWDATVIKMNTGGLTTTTNTCATTLNSTNSGQEGSKEIGEKISKGKSRREKSNFKSITYPINSETSVSVPLMDDQPINTTNTNEFKTANDGSERFSMMGISQYTGNYKKKKSMRLEIQQLTPEELMETVEDGSTTSSVSSKLILSR